jgi:hypothetical protein
VAESYYAARSRRDPEWRLRIAGTTTVAAVGLDAYELVELIPEPWEVTYTDLDAGVVLAERENDLAIYLDGEITVSNPQPSA